MFKSPNTPAAIMTFLVGLYAIPLGLLFIALAVKLVGKQEALDAYRSVMFLQVFKVPLGGWITLAGAAGYAYRETVADVEHSSFAKEARWIYERSLPEILDEAARGLVWALLWPFKRAYEAMTAFLLGVWRFQDVGGAFAADVEPGLGTGAARVARLLGSLIGIALGTVFVGAFALLMYTRVMYPHDSIYPPEDLRRHNYIALGFAVWGCVLLYFGLRSLGQAITGRAAVSVAGGLYRGTYAAFDFGRATVVRPWNLVGGAIALAFGGAAMWVGWYWWEPFFIHDRDPRFPWIAEFEAHGWVVVFAVGVLAAGQGLRLVFEALRFNIAPRTSDVHGSARPATQQEAKAAARGAAPARNLNEQRFSD